MNKYVCFKLSPIILFFCFLLFVSQLSSLSVKASETQKTWVQKSPSSSPPPRYDASMAYDEARNEGVLFGGNVGPNTGLDNDTWVWNGVDWIQKQPTISPSKRLGAKMVYDAERKQVVLFGGHNYPSFLNDTWIWDGSNWKQMQPTTSPPASGGDDASIAYDAINKQVVLYVGLSHPHNSANSRPEVVKETWIWNGSNWKQMHPLSSPSAYATHDMTYDEARQEIVLFGGLADGRGQIDETWSWNGSNWVQKYPSTSPPPRSKGKMVYDSELQQVVLFGGQNNGYFLDDTWTWDGSKWTQEHVSLSPLARSYHQMIYDKARSQVVLFSGLNNIVNDTWVYGNTIEDKTAPVTTITPVNEDWYKTNVSLNLESNDSLSGVLKMEYRINNGAWKEYKDSIVVSNEGINKVHYRSIDNAGNVEETKSVEVKIDKTAPTLNVSFNQSVITNKNHQLVPIKASVAAEDNLSGIASYELVSIITNQPDNGKGDGNTTQDIQGAELGNPDKDFLVRAERSGNGDRIYTVTYKATDNVGNLIISSGNIVVKHDNSKNKLSKKNDI